MQTIVAAHEMCRASPPAVHDQRRTPGGCCNRRYGHPDFLNSTQGIMATFIFTYDLRRLTPDPGTAFVAEAEQLGWSSWMWNPDASVWCRLPAATLVGEFEDMQAAKRAFDDARLFATARVGREVVIEKYCLSVCSDTEVRSDESRA
jgi:hypothetical protein